MLIKNKILNLTNKIITSISPKIKYNKKTFKYLLYEQSIRDSVDFVSKNMLFCEVFENRSSLYKWIFSRSNQKGMVLEFGVHQGHSINQIAKLTSKTVHGFDSFEGLPDDGIIPNFKDEGIKWYKGKMSKHGTLPIVLENVTLHKGWFDNTLPIFFKNQKEKISVMHIDCDIYSSTKSILNNCVKHLDSGTIIIFDEYLNYEGWQKNEHRALIEFSSEYKIKYEYIAYTYLGGIAIRLL